jgi:hypothetical protein
VSAPGRALDPPCIRPEAVSGNNAWANTQALIALDQIRDGDSLHFISLPEAGRPAEYPEYRAFLGKWRKSRRRKEFAKMELI